MHGEGAWLYGNGDRYDGRFANGAACGPGAYRQASGDEYVGASPRRLSSPRPPRPRSPALVAPLRA